MAPTNDTHDFRVMVLFGKDPLKIYVKDNRSSAFGDSALDSDLLGDGGVKLQTTSGA
jgi:hypothetical protein